MAGTRVNQGDNDDGVSAVLIEPYCGGHFIDTIRCEHIVQCCRCSHRATVGSRHRDNELGCSAFLAASGRHPHGSGVLSQHTVPRRRDPDNSNRSVDVDPFDLAQRQAPSTWIGEIGHLSLSVVHIYYAQ